MFSLNKLSIAVAVVLLSGCQLLGPDYQKPASILPSQYGESSDASELTVPAQWWTLYQDAVLDDLMSKALSNNKDLKVAAARIEEADAYLQEVGAALFPQVNLDAGGNRSRISETTATRYPAGTPFERNNYNAKLSTSFELDFWGKLRRAKESARAQALATRYAGDTIGLSLTGLVASNYLLLRSLDAQIKVSNDSLSNRDESLALTKRRLAGGTSSALDVAQAEVASSNLKAQIVDLVRQRALVQHQLAVLTGDLSLNLAAGDLVNMPNPPVPPAGLPSSLLEARPDVRQAEQSLIAANAKIGVAKAALYPSISLTASLGGESAELGDVLKSASRIWGAGLSLNLPIFDSGRLNSRLDQASAQQKQMLFSYENAVQTAFREVDDALVSVRQNTEREAALDQSRQSAQRALQISENRYKSGYSAYLDVLDSQRVYNDAALSYIQSRQARLVSSVDLFKALGGGWVDKEKTSAQTATAQ